MANRKRRPSTTDNGHVQASRPTVAQLRNKKPLRVPVEIVLDQDKAERLANARRELELAEARWQAAQKDDKGGPAVAARLAELDIAADEYDAAQVDAAEVIVEFAFQGLGKPRSDALRLAHPPTDADKERAKALGLNPNSLEWHDETYTPALVAACMVEPDMGRAAWLAGGDLDVGQFLDVIWHSDNWNDAERERLVVAAMTANRSMSRVDLGKAFARAYGVTSGSESSSPSATGTASPAASS